MSAMAEGEDHAAGRASGNKALRKGYRQRSPPMSSAGNPPQTKDVFYI